MRSGKSGWPQLYAIVDVDLAEHAGRSPAELAHDYLQAGVRLLQVRAKALESGPFLDLVRQIVGHADPLGARVIVNDRADIALIARAAGVHVGQTDLEAVDVRRIVGPDRLVGLSTHTAEQIDAAVALDVDYIAVGPVFTTGSKATGYAAVGLELVGYAAEQARTRGVPIVAIGGITRATAASVLAAGADSVAVISDLMAGPPARTVAEYLARI